MIKPARDELLRQAAQGEVLHNNDTGMRVLRLVREASDQRTGVFTNGIVATAQGRQIALYFTDRNTRVEEPGRVLSDSRGLVGAPTVETAPVLRRWKAAPHHILPVVPGYDYSEAVPNEPR